MLLSTFLDGLSWPNRYFLTVTIRVSKAGAFKVMQRTLSPGRYLASGPKGLRASRIDAVSQSDVGAGVALRGATPSPVGRILPMAGRRAINRVSSARLRRAIFIEVAPRLGFDQSRIEMPKALNMSIRCPCRVSPGCRVQPATLNLIT